MEPITLYKHQLDALEATADRRRVAYYHDMGLGKTYTGAEKMRQLGGRVNLVVCQKSKIDDWIMHFQDHYYSNGEDKNIILPYDLTDSDEMEMFFENIRTSGGVQLVGVINYDLIFRRPELLKVRYDTLMLDESSMIQNDRAKRTRAIMRLHTSNVILLSGTPTGGRYERLYSQLHLLGWDISKTRYYDTFVKTHIVEVGNAKIEIVTGYKNVERLKRKMNELGCHFLKTENVFGLPQQNVIDISVKTSRAYQQLCKNDVAYIGNREFIADTVLTKLLYLRMLCGAFCDAKLKTLEDILAATDDRLIIFYNFYDELEILKKVCRKHNRGISEVNGQRKSLAAYENESDSVTLIQYQAGAMGLNLQKANKVVYFTPPLSSELYEQSKKRIHRIGQTKPCFYYRLICEKTIEERIYKTLEKRQDYTEKLFESEVER